MVDMPTFRLEQSFLVLSMSKVLANVNQHRRTPTNSLFDEEKITSIAAPSNEKENADNNPEPVVVDECPDGGLRAWLVVFGVSRARANGCLTYTDSYRTGYVQHILNIRICECMGCIPGAL